MCDHLKPPKTFYINFIVYHNIGIIYNHKQYVGISVEPNLKLKIIFVDQSFTLSFVLNTWIFIAVTTSAVYFNGELKHI